MGRFGSFNCGFSHLYGPLHESGRKFQHSGILEASYIDFSATQSICCFLQILCIFWSLDLQLALWTFSLIAGYTWLFVPSAASWKGMHTIHSPKVVQIMRRMKWSIVSLAFYYVLNNLRFLWHSHGCLISMTKFWPVGAVWPFWFSRSGASHISR